MKTLKGKVVAITGAGSGIGRYLALEAARKGAFLALSDISENLLQGTVEQCSVYDATCTSTILDVSRRVEMQLWAKQTYQHFGKVNVVVNNAGVSVEGVVSDLSYADIEWIMNINFWGVVYGTKEFLPYIERSDEGHIVNVSSLYGLVALPTASAYNASKFAVRGFTESLSEELKTSHSSIGVTSVHPGGIDTNIAKSSRVIANEFWGLKDSEQSGRDFSRWAKTKPEEAAKQILEAVIGDKRRLLIGTDAKIVDILQRVLPVEYSRILSRVVKKAV